MMPKHVTGDCILVKPFEGKDWTALWELRSHQLAEAGIRIDGPPPDQPDLDSPYECDYHRIDQVYLSGDGNFWVAYIGDTPVGHVGVQDFGGVVELRRMYVRSEYRLLGVGARLVRMLIAHCVANGVKAIELWTSMEGPGRALYKKMGFRRTEEVGEEFKDKNVLCAYTPSVDELRMRLDLRGSEEIGQNVQSP